MLKRIKDYTLCAGKTIKEINKEGFNSGCAIIFTDDTYVYFQAMSDMYDNELSFDENISECDVKTLGLVDSDVAVKYENERRKGIEIKDKHEAELEKMSADELRKYIRKNKRL